MKIDNSYQVISFGDVANLKDFDKKADLTRYGDNENQVKVAIKGAKKAANDLTLALADTKLVDSQRYNLLFLAHTYAGLIEDYKKAHDFLNSGIHLEYTDAINVAKLIIAENENKNIISDTARAQKVYIDLHIVEMMETKTLFDILDPTKTKLKRQDPPEKIIKAIAENITQAPNDIADLIGKQTLFATLFTYLEKGNKVGNAKKNLDDVINNIHELQKSLKDYSIASQVGVFIPGIASAQGCKNIMDAFIRAFKSGNAERERAINASESILIKQQRMQNVKNMLESLINQNDDKTKTEYQVKLNNGLTLDDLLKVDQYRPMQDSKSLEDLSSSLANVVRNNGTMPKNNLKAYIGKLTLMLKEVQDESSEALTRMQNATYKKNTAADCLSVIVRRIFDVLEDAFLLSRKR